MVDVARYAAGVARRDAIIALRQPVGFIARWFAPIIAIAAFYFVARFVDPHRSLSVDGRSTGYFTYVSVNLSFMLLQASALQAVSQTIRYDQLIGTLEPILATPSRAALYVVGCALWPLLVSIGQVAFSLCVASLFMGLDLRATNLASLMLFALLSTLTMGAIGILSSAGVVAFKQVPPSAFFVGGAASLLAGTLFPVTLFPPVLRAISWCLPLTHALSGLRGAVAGKSIALLAPDAVWLAIASVVLFPISLAMLNAAVERARRDGTLAHY